MKVVLFSTSCPRCHVLEKKLQKNNIEFTLVQDKALMIAKGFLSAPMLEVDDVIMDFNEANKWINEQE